MQPRQEVSVIVTVRNEAATVGRLLDSLLAQTRWPDEVVIVDGGSTDGTVEVVRGYQERLPLRLLVREGSNISQGRNAAIAAARGQVIACTDAGVRLAPVWLEELLRPFEEGTEGVEGPGPDVVSGFFLADPQTVFEVALGATTLPALADVRPERFLPSSRSVAFRREAWEKVGGYPEWLDYGEDLVFDLRLRAAGYRFAFAPTAVARFRPRGSLGAFVRQYFRYARGDGKADLWRKRHAIRYLTYLVAGPLLLLLGLVQSPLWWMLLLAGMAIVLWTPYRRLAPLLAGYSLGDRVKAVLWVPLIRLAGDAAKMAGYPVGWAWRWRH